MTMKSHQDDLKTRIIWLMAFRLALVTGLTVISTTNQMEDAAGFNSNELIPVFSLLGFCYFITLLSLITQRFIHKIDLFANIQIAVDIFIATALIYVTGGIDSAFSFLYIFVIIWSGIILYGRGVFLTASLSSILYGSLLDLQHYGIIPLLESPFSGHQMYSAGQLTYKIIVNITAFYTVAFLSNYLFAQLRMAGERLKEKEIDYDALEARNKRIVERINSGIMTINQAGIITSFNKAAEDITGYKLIEVYDTKMEDIFPGFTEMIETYSIENSDQAVPRRLETSYVNKSGESLHLGLSISAISDSTEGEVSCIIIFQNLTTFKAMEDAFRRAERLAVAGKLAAGMAHEIRNPLASMSGAIQMLRNELSLSPENARLMDIIIRESERLNNLITNFLNYTRPYVPQKFEMDLSSTLHDMLDVFEKGLSIDQDIHVVRNIEIGISIMGDQEKIKEVFWNLFNNAVQSMKPGGEIFISLTAHGRRATVMVRDNGEGIDEKDIKQVFQPFFTTKTYGTGLGLASVYRIVEAHKGEIKVQSEKGQGTVFTITLPIS